MKILVAVGGLMLLAGCREEPWCNPRVEHVAWLTDACSPIAHVEMRVANGEVYEICTCPPFSEKDGGK